MTIIVLRTFLKLYMRSGLSRETTKMSEKGVRSRNIIFSCVRAEPRQRTGRGSVPAVDTRVKDIDTRLETARWGIRGALKTRITR